MHAGRIAWPVHTAFVLSKVIWAESEKNRKMSVVAVDLSPVLAVYESSARCDDHLGGSELATN